MEIENNDQYYTTQKEHDPNIQKRVGVKKELNRRDSKQ